MKKYVESSVDPPQTPLQNVFERRRPTFKNFFILENTLPTRFRPFYTKSKNSIFSPKNRFSPTPTSKPTIHEIHGFGCAGATNVTINTRKVSKSGSIFRIKFDRLGRRNDHRLLFHKIFNETKMKFKAHIPGKTNDVSDLHT